MSALRPPDWPAHAPVGLPSLHGRAELSLHPSFRRLSVSGSTPLGLAIGISEGLNAVRQLSASTSVPLIRTSNEGTEGVEIPDLAENGQTRPLPDVVAVPKAEIIELCSGPSEADSLEGIGQVELAGAHGCFVPITEPGVLFVPEGVAWIRITMDVSLAQRELQFSISIQQLLAPGSQPLALGLFQVGTGIHSTLERCERLVLGQGHRRRWQGVEGSQ